MKTTVYHRSERTQESFLFGVTDRLGREIGADVYLYQIEYREVPEETRSGYYDHIAPGVYWAFVPQATRNGHPYGAGQPERRFTTRDQRRLAIEQYIKGAQARAHANASSRRGRTRRATEGTHNNAHTT